MKKIGIAFIALFSVALVACGGGGSGSGGVNPKGNGSLEFSLSSNVPAKDGAVVVDASLGGTFSMSATMSGSEDVEWIIGLSEAGNLHTGEQMFEGYCDVDDCLNEKQTIDCVFNGINQIRCDFENGPLTYIGDPLQGESQTAYIMMISCTEKYMDSIDELTPEKAYANCGVDRAKVTFSK